MKNISLIELVVDYIEKNLKEDIDINSISKEFGYSIYHLSRMFSSCVGFSIHEYIRRRRISEAAKALVKTDDPILNIALDYGYSNQQSFTVGFKDIYNCSPNEYRKNNEYAPYQLKITVTPQINLKGDMIMNISEVKNYQFNLVGFYFNTKEGFQNIGPLWGRLHSSKNNIPNRVDTKFTIAVNDYHSMNESNPFFDYFAVVEVNNLNEAPEGMISKILPASNYIVFRYIGKAEDSMEPVVNYIYKEWFPQSDKVLNEEARFDLVKYGEEQDENGNVVIEYWVPIK